MNKSRQMTSIFQPKMFQRFALFEPHKSNPNEFFRFCFYFHFQFIYQTKQLFLFTSWMRHSFRRPFVEMMSANRSKSIHQYFCHFFENFNPAIDLKDENQQMQMYSKVQLQWESICMKSRSTLKIHHVNAGTYIPFTDWEEFIRNGKPKRWTNIHKNSIALIFKWHKAFDIVIAFDLSLSIRFRLSVVFLI